jgi:hypothetical protein
MTCKQIEIASLAAQSPIHIIYFQVHAAWLNLNQEKMMQRFSAQVLIPKLLSIKLRTALVAGGAKTLCSSA